MAQLKLSPPMWLHQPLLPPPPHHFLPLPLLSTAQFPRPAARTPPNTASPGAPPQRLPPPQQQPAAHSREQGTSPQASLVSPAPPPTTQGPTPPTRREQGMGISFLSRPVPVRSLPPQAAVAEAVHRLRYRLRLPAASKFPSHHMRPPTERLP